jgi:uncharacterized protein
MSVAVMLMLFAAGIAGGAINAVAGGATLLTFPVLMAAGLSPIVANATSSAALTPGHLTGALSEFKQLPKFDAAAWASIAIMILGGMAGAVLLFYTSERVFTVLVPILIGAATLIFAFGKKLQAWLGQTNQPAEHAAPRLIGLLPTSLYVGYFGAGAGVVMMALFAITSNWQIRTANAFKNVLGAVANWAAIAIFISTGLISWPETIVMLLGAIIGGLAGGQLLRILSATTIRSIVIIAGTIMTIVYAWRYWL